MACDRFIYWTTQTPSREHVTQALRQYLGEADGTTPADLYHEPREAKPQPHLPSWIAWDGPEGWEGVAPSRPTPGTAAFNDTFWFFDGKDDHLSDDAIDVLGGAEAIIRHLLLWNAHAHGLLAPLRRVGFRVEVYRDRMFSFTQALAVGRDSDRVVVGRVGGVWGYRPWGYAGDATPGDAGVVQELCRVWRYCLRRKGWKTLG